MKIAAMKPQTAIVLLMLITFSCTSARYRPGGCPIRQGAGDFIFTDARGNPNRPVKVWYYQPSGPSRDMKVLFVMHGMKRDARRYRDEWVQFAKNCGFLLIVPEFSHKYFPGNREYNEGNVFDRMENPVPENGRAFAVIEHLFDFVKGATHNQSPSYDIYGHSAGGQFVQRMLLFKTDARIRMAIAANPGIYVFPVYSEKYPFGIRNSGITPDHLRAAFERNFVLLLGDKNVNDDDMNLARPPEVMDQGDNSFERGNNFFDASLNEASRLGMIFNWKLTIVPDAGNDNVQLAPTAARLFYPDGNK